MAWERCRAVTLLAYRRPHDLGRQRGGPIERVIRHARASMASVPDDPLTAVRKGKDGIAGSPGHKQCCSTVRFLGYTPTRDSAGALSLCRTVRPLCSTA